MYVKTSNGAVEQYPYTLGDLRRDNPNTSFPKSISDTVLASYGVYPVTKEDRPSFDERTQAITRNTTPTQTGGVWSIGWTVTDRTAEQIQEYDDLIAQDVRTQRNEKLAGTDWWMLSDHTATQAQIDYRQALRDVPSQSGFPHTITWPTKP